MSEKPSSKELDQGPSINGAATMGMGSTEKDQEPGVAAAPRAPKDQRSRYKYNIFWRGCFM